MPFLRPRALRRLKAARPRQPLQHQVGLTAGTVLQDPCADPGCLAIYHLTQSTRDSSSSGPRLARAADDGDEAKRCGYGTARRRQPKMQGVEVDDAISGRALGRKRGPRAVANHSSPRGDHDERKPDGGGSRRQGFRKKEISRRSTSETSPPAATRPDGGACWTRSTTDGCDHSRGDGGRDPRPPSGSVSVYTRWQHQDAGPRHLPSRQPKPPNATCQLRWRFNRRTATA